MTKVLAVTGASGTLGRAVLERFRASSELIPAVWKVYGCAKHHHDLGWIEVEPVDVTDNEQVVDWFNRTGRVDAVVTCAGVSLVKSFLDMTAEEWKHVIDVNLNGTAYAVREAIRWGATRIVTIGSIHGATSTSYPDRSPYATSKGGVRALTEELAVEFGPMGISANCLCPGHLPHLMPGTGAGSELLSAARKRTPQDRLATAEECAEVIWWLCNDAPVTMTGQTIIVDGGFTLNTWPMN